MMQYKKIPMLTCKNGCKYKLQDEICTLTLERYKEHYDSNTFGQICCAGHPNSYMAEKVKAQLILEERGYDAYGNPTRQEGDVRNEDEPGSSTEPPAVVPVQQIIPPYRSYSDYKQALDQEIRTQAEGFVRIGYLLKLARDTNILFESGYKDLYAFAEAEYRLDKSQVSRYIGINDRFSIDGYSMELDSKYQGFGIAKLAIMLTLPDAVNEELSPAYSKSEIRTIREELAEEQKVTNIERILEGQDDPDDSTIDKVIWQLGMDETELFKEIFENYGGDIRNLKEIMAPDSEKIYSVRIKGVGRIILMLKDYEDQVALVNSRDGSKELCTWEEVGRSWVRITKNAGTVEECYRAVYGTEFSEDGEKAEVQAKPDKTPKVSRAKPDKTPKVSRAKPDKTSKATKEKLNQPPKTTRAKPDVAVGGWENDGETKENDIQIPGRMEISDFTDRQEEAQEEGAAPADGENRQKEGSGKDQEHGREGTGELEEYLEEVQKQEEHPEGAREQENDLAAVQEQDDHQAVVREQEGRQAAVQEQDSSRKTSIPEYQRRRIGNELYKLTEYIDLERWKKALEMLDPLREDIEHAIRMEERNEEE